MNTDTFFETLMKLSDAITPKESHVSETELNKFKEMRESIPFEKRADDLMQMMMEDI